MRQASAKPETRSARSQPTPLAVPPHAFFVVSAVFHYLGPAFAVLLFAEVSVLGVAWLRIASAALVFACWRRPWRQVAGWSTRQQRDLIGLGIVLGAMNVCFYLAIARLPLGTVGAIEFLGPIVLAAAGVRSARNAGSLGLAIVGVGLLTNVRIEGEPLGFVFAFANCILFMLYILLGHRVAQDGGGAGIDRLGAAMLVALVVVMPIGILDAAPAIGRPELLLAGIGVGICSSVIPYVCDQLAMARLPRSTFALLLALLPATAVAVGVLILRQVPSSIEAGAVTLIVMAVAMHQSTRADDGAQPRPTEERHDGERAAS
ncbi:MAG TPA: hypothetical protein VEX37_06725 [Thermomicrobiales bacterium]|nr:hypothetical protein [Thermomicrobiales bacterium]